MLYTNSLVLNEMQQAFHNDNLSIFKLDRIMRLSIFKAIMDKKDSISSKDFLILK